MAGISFGGLASGLDTEAIIDAMVQAAREPIRLLEGKQNDYNRILSLTNTLGSQLGNLRTVAKSMDTSSEFLSMKATSSDDTAVTATASSTAAAGTYELVVTALAETERTYSDALAAKDATGLVGTGTLTIQVGSDAAVPISIDQSTDTLEAVASMINSESALRASASVVFDGTNYRLVVIGEDTGAANGITFTEGGTLALNLDVPANQRQAAQDATIQMDGLTFSSASNQLTETIAGLTIDLKKVTDPDPVTIRVDVDADAVKGKVQAFVDKYNEVARFFQQQFTFSGEARSDTLLGDSTARTIQGRLRGILGAEVSGAGSTYTILSSIGVAVEKDGTLSLDATKLTDALADNRAEVAALFSFDDGDSALDTDGIAVRLVNMLDGMLQAPDGLLETRKEGLGDSISSVKHRIEEVERRVDSYEQRLRRQYTALEQAMSEFQSIGSFLAQQ